MVENPVYVRMSTENEAPLFQSRSSAELVIGTLITAQHRDWLRVHGFVILPEGLEMVCTPLKQSISGVVAHLQAESIPLLMVLLPQSGLIWARRFAQMPLTTRGAFTARMEMLLLAPVAAGLSETAADYAYSSANPRYSSVVAPYAGFMQTGLLSAPDAKPTITELPRIEPAPALAQKPSTPPQPAVTATPPAFPPAPVKSVSSTQTSEIAAVTPPTAAPQPIPKPIEQTEKAGD